MLGYDFTYRGVSLSDSLFDASNGKGIILQKVDWSDVVTDDDQNPRQGDHGVEASPTLYRGRLIDIEGVICANTRSERQTYRTTLENMFKLEYVPAPDNKGFYDFTFNDDDGTRKLISAKILNTPAFEQLTLGEVEFTSFKVQLFAEDPAIKANTPSSGTSVEGFYGGVSFPVAFDTAFDDYGYVASLLNSGTWRAPLKVTITATGTTGTNMRVINTATGEYFGIASAMVSGDVLVIDTENATITLNGVNVSGDRIAGSIWPFLEPSYNTYTVMDDMTRLGDGLYATVNFQWSNTWI